MRFLVFGLTLTAVILFILQFFGKKGNKWHITKGYLVGFLSMIVVITNTILFSLNDALVWDLFFKIHVFLGTIFFIVLIATAISGHQLKRNKIKSSLHRLFFISSGILLILTLVTIPAFWR